MVEAERYLAEAVRLRGLGEQVAADVRERLRELDRCVADAERLVAEMWTARLRALHHFDQRPARERMTSDRCRECGRRWSDEAQRRSQDGRDDGAQWARLDATRSKLMALAGAAPDESAAGYVSMLLDRELDRLSELGMFDGVDDDGGETYWAGFQRGATEVFDVALRRL